MDKESIYLLQKIDCNCNDCGYMERDMVKFNKWRDWNMKLQLADFEKLKKSAFLEAELCPDEKGKKTLLHRANRLKFMFDSKDLLHYGKCTKLNKEVSFSPETCQIDTQSCFKHRKEF